VKPSIVFGAVLALFPLAGIASNANINAGVTAIAMPADTRLVTFSYDQNNSYTILTRPQSHTNIQLPPDEELVVLALGDTSQWMVSNVPGHVFIKPLHPNLVTSGTLVTNKRTYQLTLRSIPIDGQFYQQVTWNTPQMITYHSQIEKVEGFAKQAEEKAKPVVSVSDSVALDQVGFEYTIEGEADFKPTHVFDDGRFTWIRMPQIQEMPALFMLNEFDEAELLNYTVKEPYFIVQRLVPGLLLKLGDKEVKVLRGDKKQQGGGIGSFFRLFGESKK
jgi:type IV secretion system protein VirB9